MLNLSRNNISTIDGLRELTRLRILNLSYNRLFRIGHGIPYSGFYIFFLSFHILDSILKDAGF